MKPFLRALFVLAIGATPLMAAPLQLVCSAKAHGSGDWIPEVLFIAHQTGADTAIVSDPIILHFNEAPVTAKVQTDNANKLTVGWQVFAKSSSGQNARLEYRASYFRKSGKLTVFMEPSSYDNRFTGEGTCKVMADQ